MVNKHEIQLGGYIHLSGKNSNKSNSHHRVIGLNPKIKLQQILTVNGEQELGGTLEYEWNDIKHRLERWSLESHWELK